MTETNTPVDVARLLDDGEWSGFQKLVLLLAAIAFAVDGFANQVLGLAIPAMVKTWNVSRDAFAPVFFLGLGGLAIGTIIGGMLADRFGRRPTLIGSVLVFGAATACISLATNIDQLIILRILDGLGLGAAVPCATSLIAEYTPAKRRSMAISIGMIFIPMGGILSGAAAVKLLPGDDWQGMFLVAAASALLVAFILFFTLPESPRFLLRNLARHDELKRLMRRFGHPVAAGAPLLQEEPPRKISVPIAMLFKPAIKMDTLAIWAGFFCCLVATYTIQSWAPTALAGAGIGGAQIGGVLAGFGAGGIIGSLIAGAAIGWMGSRKTIIVFSAIAIVFSAILSASQLEMLGAFKLALGLGLLGAALSAIQSPLYALAANIYPASCRGTGVGMASAVGRIGAMASSFTGVMSLNMCGTQGFFLFLAAMVALCALAILPIKRHIAPN